MPSCVDAHGPVRRHSHPLGRRLASAAALIAAAILWSWIARELWRSSVPSSLHLPHVDAHQFFSSSFLHRSSSFSEFLDIDALAATVALIVVLVAYARRGHRLMRESAAGRVGTGLLLGMLGFGLIWLAEVPFILAAVGWEHSHHISHQGYFAALLESFFGLGSTFLFVSLALAVAMGLAGALRRWWWLVAAPLFAALALLSSFVGPYLIANTHALHDPAVAADARSLARIENVPGTKVLVQKVSRSVTVPNAEATGFGPTRRVVLWDTLLDGRFSRREIAVVVAHELGHIAHGHILKGVGWLVLFLFPATAIVTAATRRRGGLAQPEAVPVALLVFVVLQLATVPLSNIVSRHVETEADWSALQATHEPATARALFQRLSMTSLNDPDPPAWVYVLYETHPTIAQRIALTEAWQARSGRN
jgi:STE24 endopeptidase